mmetsp:Transcript_60718/g.54697  ORF Transcript_60718/g.54697 Transcript_60718/m.54697 type:complete len:276 (-) Transcript_60718:94-921(-)
MVDSNVPKKPIDLDDKNFEFDCPQFTDLSTIDPLSEEYCQEFFDKKTEEIKRNSNEFALELDKNETQQNNNNNMDMEISEDDDSDDENISSKPIENLLSATEFNKSNLSNSSKRKSNESSISSHLYSIHTNKINKNRNQLTSEELVLKNLEQKKVEIEKIKEKNAKNVAKMREDHHVFHPVRSTKLTIPITPALHTTMRAKKRLNKNKDNKDNKENDDKQQFHARKFNPKIFKQNASNLGILNNVKNKMTTTTVQPFSFQTEKRAQKYQNQKNHR